MNIELIASILDVDSILTVEFIETTLDKTFYIVYDVLNDKLLEISKAELEEANYKKFKWEELNSEEQKIVDSVIYSELKKNDIN